MVLVHCDLHAAGLKLLAACQAMLACMEDHEEVEREGKWPYHNEKKAARAAIKAATGNNEYTVSPEGFSNLGGEHLPSRSVRKPSDRKKKPT